MAESLYEQMKKIGEGLAVVSKGSHVEYLKAYKDDLYVYDKDVMENDSQAGDRYLWEVKGSGAGTYCNLIQGEKMHMWERPEDSQFYLLNCTGINEGDISVISAEMAQQIHLKIPARENRVPRRLHLFSAMKEKLGVNLRDSKFANDFNIKEDLEFAIKVTPKRNMEVEVTVVLLTDGQVSPIKKHQLYHAQVHDFHYGHQQLLEGSMFAYVSTFQDGYGKVENKDKQFFENAIKSLNNELKRGTQRLVAAINDEPAPKRAPRLG
ncbi:MAG: hypothetical protein HAW67_05310 [Endozoicomonadaceae bacterium]|nr:hypothetical protein [Endozoicomonadaceae bacterium]